MIKNNLNIAQQVNCSGISSSLFLFFDSKILCLGYLIQESHLRWGARTLKHFPFWSLPQQGTWGHHQVPLLHILHLLQSIPVCSGAELHGTSPFPQNLSELKRKNRIKEMTNPLPAIKTGWSTRKERWKPVSAWPLPQSKWVLSQILVFSRLDWLSERVQKSLHNLSYNLGEDVHLKSIISLCTTSGKAFPLQWKPPQWIRVKPSVQGMDSSCLIPQHHFSKGNPDQILRKFRSSTQTSSQVISSWEFIVWEEPFPVKTLSEHLPMKSHLGQLELQDSSFMRTFPKFLCLGNTALPAWRPITGLHMIRWSQPRIRQLVKIQESC